MNLVGGKTSFSTTQFYMMCEKLRGLNNIIFKDSNYKGKICLLNLIQSIKNVDKLSHKIYVVLTNILCLGGSLVISG